MVLSETRRVTNEKTSARIACAVAHPNAGLSEPGTARDQPHAPDVSGATARWPSRGLHRQRYLAHLGPSADRRLRGPRTASSRCCYFWGIFAGLIQGQGRDSSIHTGGPRSLSQDPPPEAPSNGPCGSWAGARGSAGHVLAQMMSYHRMEANGITGAQKRGRDSLRGLCKTSPINAYSTSTSHQDSSRAERRF